MDAISSTIVPLVVAGTVVVGGAYLYQRLNNKKIRYKKSKPTNDGPTISESDILPAKREKKRKAANAPTKKQKRIQVELTSVDSDDEDDNEEATPAPEVKTEAKPAAKSADKKKADAVVSPVVAATTEKKGKNNKKAKAEVKKEEPKQETAEEIEHREILALRRRIEELEARERGEIPKPAAVAAPAAAPAASSGKGKKNVTPPPAMVSSPSTSSEEGIEDDGWTTIEARKRTRTKKASKATVPDEDLLAPLITTGDIRIPADKRFAIVGSKGQLLNDITEATKVRIDIPRVTAEVPGNTMIRVDLTGSPEGIELARGIITDLITRGFSPQLQPDKTEAKIRVDRKQCSAILAEKGAFIRKIQSVTGCTINIPKEDDEDDILRIVGEASQVPVARENIVSLILDGFSELTHEGWIKMQTPFPVEHRRHLIGPSARVINAIQGSSGCRINIPDSPEKEYVVVVGPSDNVYGAIDDINKVIAKINTPVNDVYATGFTSNDFSKNEIW